MKNILYLGSYKNSNGYGYSSRRFIDCLSSNNDINLSIRPLFYNNSAIKNPLSTDKYDEYENNSSKYYDTVIQHCYPDFYVYDKRFGKNIGIVQIETKNLQRSGWTDKLNLMDEIWVGSLFAQQSLLDINVKVPIRVIPEPYTIDQYNNANLQPFFSIKTKDRPFIFYTIGQYTEKKNIKGIILAFILEFSKKENVRLFIKTGDYNIDPKELENIIKYDIHSIKTASRKYDDCADIDIVTGIVKDIDIVRLHADADCYVNAVRSDDGGSCAIEAKLSDRIVINTNNIGSSSYFNTTNALIVDSVETCVFSSDVSNYAIFTTHEYWMEPEIDSLRKSMRMAYFMNKEQKDLFNKNFNKNIFNKDELCKVLV